MNNLENCVYWERTPAYILSVFLQKTYELFQTRRKWTCDYNKCPWLFQNFYDLSFSHDFSRPGNDHFKFPCFSRFSMTVRTLMNPLAQKHGDGWSRVRTQTTVICFNVCVLLILLSLRIFQIIIHYSYKSMWAWHKDCFCWSRVRTTATIILLSFNFLRQWLFILIHISM